jgi:hypothetical protein
MKDSQRKAMFASKFNSASDRLRMSLLTDMQPESPTQENRYKKKYTWNVRYNNLSPIDQKYVNKVFSQKVFQKQ